MMELRDGDRYVAIMEVFCGGEDEPGIYDELILSNREEKQLLQDGYTINFERIPTWEIPE